MLTGWLIYSKKDVKRNKAYIDWFISEAKKQNIQLTLIYRETLTIGMKNNKQTILLNKQVASLPQFTIIRTIEPILQYIFESLGVYTFNNYDVARICNDKKLTYLAMNRLKIPTLDTLFFNRTLPNKPPLAYPFVIKDAYGRSGKQVYLINNFNDWEKVKQKINFNEIIIQDGNVQLGKDVRVFIIGKKIIAAVLRKNKHDFRANFTLGGQAIPYELNQKEIKMIKKIIRHFDFGLVGIDFLINYQEGLIFNEIEDVVGSRILSETSRINLLQKYISFIKGRLK